MQLCNDIIACLAKEPDEQNDTEQKIPALACSGGNGRAEARTLTEQGTGRRVSFAFLFFDGQRKGTDGCCVWGIKTTR